MVVVMWGRLGEGLKMIWWYTKYVVGLKKCSGRFLSWSIWPSGCRFYDCRSWLRSSTMECMALVPTGHWRNPLRARAKTDPGATKCVNWVRTSRGWMTVARWGCRKLSFWRSSCRLLFIHLCGQILLGDQSDFQSMDSNSYVDNQKL